MGDFVFDYFVGSISACLVVGIFTIDAHGTVERTLSLVD